MLWIIVIVAFFVGVFYICCSSQTKRKKLCLTLVLVAIEVISLFTLGWCFTRPIKGNEIKSYNVTKSDMILTKESITFIGMDEKYPYTYRDMTIGYTTCEKVSDASPANVIVYEEKFSILKSVLGFKVPQNVVYITYNSNNEIIMQH